MKIMWERLKDKMSRNERKIKIKLVQNKRKEVSIHFSIKVQKLLINSIIQIRSLGMISWKTLTSELLLLFTKRKALNQMNPMKRNNHHKYLKKQHQFSMGVTNQLSLVVLQLMMLRSAAASGLVSVPLKRRAKERAT